MVSRLYSEPLIYGAAYGEPLPLIYEPLIYEPLIYCLYTEPLIYWHVLRASRRCHFPDPNWVRFLRAVAVVYFSPRLLCRFDLAVRAISIRRRMASGRVNGMPSCLDIHVSSFARSVGCRRTSIGTPLPVGGGPRFFRDITD
jgi:hypothetical protein